MLGVLWGKESLLERIRPYRVETNKNETPGKFEQGMLNNAALASLEAALAYLLWLADEAAGDKPITGRRDKFDRAMQIIADYEQKISRRVLEGFQGLDPRRFTAFGLKDPNRVADRDPTFAFEFAGQSALETKKLLWERHSIQIADGNHYSAAVTRHLKKPALCRASFAHYDTLEAADRFQAALVQLLEKRSK
jgi:selenocysteine lyase/cysteine desulfurase